MGADRFDGHFDSSRIAAECLSGSRSKKPRPAHTQKPTDMHSNGELIVATEPNLSVYEWVGGHTDREREEKRK